MFLLQDFISHSRILGIIKLKFSRLKIWIHFFKNYFQKSKKIVKKIQINSEFLTSES